MLSIFGIFCFLLPLVSSGLNCSQYTQFCCTNAAIRTACREHCEANSPCASTQQNQDQKTHISDTPSSPPAVADVDISSDLDLSDSRVSGKLETAARQPATGNRNLGGFGGSQGVTPTPLQGRYCLNPIRSSQGQSRGNNLEVPSGRQGTRSQALAGNYPEQQGFRRVQLQRPRSYSRQQQRQHNNGIFRHCCECFGVPPECWSLCFYGPESNPLIYTAYSDWQTAVNQHNCSLKYASVISYCASQGRNNQACCQRVGMTTLYNQNCMRFCDVKGANGIKRFAREDLECLANWSVIARCHEESLDKFFPGPNFSITG